MFCGRDRGLAVRVFPLSPEGRGQVRDVCLLIYRMRVRDNVCDTTAGLVHSRAF